MIYRITTGTLFQVLGEESVLLNLKAEQYYGLDPVGTRMWELLTQNIDIEATIQQLLAEYDTEETTLRSDLRELIEQLVAKGLLEVVPA
jgi:hypothetical protein